MPKQQISFDNIVGKTISGISGASEVWDIGPLVIAFTDGTFASCVARNGYEGDSPSIQDNPTLNMLWCDEKELLRLEIVTREELDAMKHKVEVDAVFEQERRDKQEFARLQAKFGA